MEIDINDLAKVQGIGPKTIERVREFVNSKNGYKSAFSSSLYLKKDSLNLGDCLELMNGIPNTSVDMVLADLPYGTTQCSWDSSLPLSRIWQQYNRISKPNTAIVLTCKQPFTTQLINSNIRSFRYSWCWEKSKATGFLNASRQPLVAHEDIVVFYNSLPTYNPQMESGDPYNKGLRKEQTKDDIYGEFKQVEVKSSGKRYPRTVVYFKTAESMGPTLHKTQKPVELFEYLIKTYTNEGDLVLDNTAGVCTTAIACINTSRRYICIEKEEGYHKMGSRWAELVEDGMDYKEAMKQVKKEFEE